MSKRAKLLERVLNNPANVRFQEIQKLLELAGFKLERVTGDHYIFKKTGYRPISVPYTQPVKSHIVREVIKIVQDMSGEQD